MLDTVQSSGARAKPLPKMLPYYSGSAQLQCTTRVGRLRRHSNRLVAENGSQLFARFANPNQPNPPCRTMRVLQGSHYQPTPEMWRSTQKSDCSRRQKNTD